MPSLNPAVASALRAAFGERAEPKSLESHTVDDASLKDRKVDSESKLTPATISSDPKTQSTYSSLLPEPAPRQAPDTTATDIFSNLELRRRRYQDSIGKIHNDVARVNGHAEKEKPEDTSQEQEHKIPPDGKVVFSQTVNDARGNGVEDLKMRRIGYSVSDLLNDIIRTSESRPSKSEGGTESEEADLEKSSECKSLGSAPKKPLSFRSSNSRRKRKLVNKEPKPASPVIKYVSDKGSIKTSNPANLIRRLPVTKDDGWKDDGVKEETLAQVHAAKETQALSKPLETTQAPAALVTSKAAAEGPAKPNTQSTPAHITMEEFMSGFFGRTLPPGSRKRAAFLHEQSKSLSIPFTAKDRQQAISDTMPGVEQNASTAAKKRTPPTSTSVTRKTETPRQRSAKDAPLGPKESLRGRSMKEALLSKTPHVGVGLGIRKDNLRSVSSPFLAEGLLNPKKVERKIADMERLKSPILQVDAKRLEITALDVDQPAVPSLSYGLDRVLFNPGVYQLQDPRSRVYNFDPYLQTIMPASEFDYGALGEFITSSKDNRLQDLAKSHNKRYIGSTSSMSSVLSHFHFLLSQWREINANTVSKAFPTTLKSFTVLSRCPQAIFLKWQNGTYAIDADKEFASMNVLSMLGKSMEKLLTLDTKDYEQYRKSNEDRTAAGREKESYHYTTMGDFLMRSQLDAHDSRLPGTGMFDLKTRAVVTVRMDAQAPEMGAGYEIKSRFGEWESYEREYYDMIRSAMLKYSLQVRMGRMDGIFVAFHNTERIFGFQYVSLPELDLALHGQEDTILGDQEFKISLDLLNKILDRAAEKFPGQSLRLHFETREAQTTFMYAFAEPVTEAQLRAIQGRNDAKMAEVERDILGLDSESENLDDEKDASRWREIQASVEETMSKDEKSAIEDNSALTDETLEMVENSPNRNESDSELRESQELQTDNHGGGLTLLASDPASELMSSDEQSTLEAAEHQEQQILESSEVSSGSETSEETPSTPASGTTEGNESGSADSNLQTNLAQRQSETEAQMDDLATRREDEESGDQTMKSQESSAMPSVEAEVLVKAPAGGFEEDQTQPLEQPGTSLEPRFEELTTPPNGNDSEGEPARMDSADTSSILVLHGSTPSDTTNAQPSSQEPTIQSDEDETGPSKADTAFLDEIIRESETQEEQSEVLGMVLTVRNKVNGGYVLRPTNLGIHDHWAAEYTLEEVAGPRARSLYEACKLRRKKALEMAEKTDEQAAADYYIKQMRRLSQEGKIYRKKLNKMDKDRPVVVYGSMPVKDDGLEKAA